MGEAAEELHRLVRELAAQPADTLSLVDVRALTAVAARGYAAALERGEAGEPVAPEAINATEAVVLCRGLMAAADIELFELSMWGSIQADGSAGSAVPTSSEHEGTDDDGRR